MAALPTVSTRRVLPDLSDDVCARLREAFRRASYDADGVVAALGGAAHAALGRGEPLPAERASRDAGDLGTLAAPARSLAEFWGNRWNVAFHQLAHTYAFDPLRRSIGPKKATLFVFFISGLVHELVISLPADAGCGLPTAYFLLQGVGLLFERSAAGRRLGLGHGLPGWLFSTVIVGGPVFWLFHPPFIHHVILPFLRQIGSF